MPSASRSRERPPPDREAAHEPPVHPPLARFARRVLPWVFAALFALLATVSLLGRVISAHLEGEEVRLGLLIGSATGYDVTVERIEGRFLAGHPLLEVEGFALAPRGAPPAVLIGRARVEIDVLESLWRLRPVARTLVVEDATVDLAPAADGGWRLRRGGDVSPDPEPIVGFLYHSDYVDLRRAEVRLWPSSGGEADRIELDGALVDDGTDHRGRLDLRLYPALEALGEREAFEGADAFSEGIVHVDFDGDPLSVTERGGEILVDVERVPLTLLTGGLLAREPTASGMLERLRVRASLDRERGFDVRAFGSARRLDAGAKDPVPVRNARFEFSGRDLTGAGGDVRFQELRARVGEEPLDLDGTQLAWRGAADERDWYARLPPFEVESVVRLLLTLDVLGQKANRYIANLDPEAEVLGVRLHVAGDQGAAAVGIRDLRLRGYQGVPTVRGADATAVFFEGGGWVDLDSGPFYVRLPEVFAEGWRYDSGRGRVNLRFAPDATHVVSDDLEITGPAGRIRGRFAMYLPPELERRRLTLMLALADVDAAFTEAYLPERMEADTRRWIVDAVRAGRIPQGAVTLLSDMQRTDDRMRTSAIWFDMREGRIDYSPEWPVASSLDARIVLEPEAIRGRIATARIAGVEVDGADLLVERDGDAPRVLALDGRGRADGGALLDFLRRAPLEDTFEFLETGWAAGGPTDLDFGLTLPLDDRPATRIEVDATFAWNALRIPQGRVTLEEFGGTLVYRHPGRISLDGAEGRLLGGPVRLSLEGDYADAASAGDGAAMADGAGDETSDDGSDDASGEGPDEAGRDRGLVVRFEGEADGAALARWLETDALARLDGRLAHEGVLRLGPDRRVEVDVTATGDDLTTGLPSPYAARPAPLTVRLDAPADGASTVDLAWADLSGRFVIDDGELRTGAVGLAEDVPPMPELGLRVRGRARSVEVGAWLAAVDRIAEDAAARGAGPDRATLLDVGVDIDDARWGALDFGGARLDLAGSTDALQIDFAAQRVDGSLRIPGDDRPLDLILTRLELPIATVGEGDPLDAPPVPPGSGDAVDEGLLAAVDDTRVSVVGRLTEDLDLAAMPDLDVRIESFSYLDEDLGRASFEIRPDDDGLVLEAIDAVGRGLAFGPDAAGRARVDLRLIPMPETRVAGRLSGEDSVAVMERWGLAPTVESDEFAFELDLNWPSHLDTPDLGTVAGTVGLDFERGRFVQIDAASGPLRVVGLFNLGAIARRLRLDFTDVYKRGVAFEDIDGVLAFEDGRLVTREAVRIAGPSSRFLIEGGLDLATERIDADLIVTLPVGSNIPWYAASAAMLANPIAGAGMIVAERLFRDQLERVSSARYRIEGSLDAPEIVLDTIFENEVPTDDADDADDVPGSPDDAPADEPDEAEGDTGDALAAAAPTPTPTPDTAETDP